MMLYVFLSCVIVIETNQIKLSLKCHYLMKVSVELSLQVIYYILITFKICGKTVPANQNLRIL